MSVLEYSLESQAGWLEGPDVSQMQISMYIIQARRIYLNTKGAHLLIIPLNIRTKI